jgi:hypothetical protein
MIELATAEEQDPRRGQPLTRCAASRDGECDHPQCPQAVNYQTCCPLWQDPEES